MKRKEKAFTFIELMIVIVIVGILASVAIPVLKGEEEKSINGTQQTTNSSQELKSIND